jgi:hypothetical protein
MSKKKTNRKKSLKKQKPVAAKKIARRAKLALKKKAAPKKKVAVKKKAAPKKNAAVKKNAALKKNATPKQKAAPKKKAVVTKAVSQKKMTTTPAVVQRGSQSVETERLKRKGLGTRAGVGAGDYQGVSTVADVDSESAEELLEEGQAFEAGIVKGVEDAGDADESEVTTHEVPQDDVPGEYDGKDRP